MASNCLNLEQLLANVQRTRDKKVFIQKFGDSQKASDFGAAIQKLNERFCTSFYLEHEYGMFSLCGHREFGILSRRSGSLKKNVTMTLGSREIEKAKDGYTLKMIVDDENNYVVVSLTGMMDLGMLEDAALSKHKGGVKNDAGRFFYSWSLEEVGDAILFSDII